MYQLPDTKVNIFIVDFNVDQIVPISVDIDKLLEIRKQVWGIEMVF